MSSCVECKKEHNSKTEYFVSCAAKDAVFTVSQTEKIVQIASGLDSCLIKAIEELKPIDNSLDLKKIECEINGLIAYDEKNTEDVKCIERKVEHLECEMKSMSDKTAHALLSQAKELDRVASETECLEHEVKKLECEVKELACREFKDERIDCILGMISSLCKHSEFEKLKCELEKLEKEVMALACREFKDERIEEILKRLAYLEARKLEDIRVDALICELSKLEKQITLQEAINCKQQKSIDALYAQNVHQCEEIKALNLKLDRNSIALDNKIDCLEKEEYTDKKVDASQSAQIATMQTQMCKVQAEIDRIEKILLTKPVVC